MEGSNELGTSGGGGTGGKPGGGGPTGMLSGGRLVEGSNNSWSELSLARNSRIGVYRKNSLEQNSPGDATLSAITLARLLVMGPTSNCQSRPIGWDVDF